MVLNKTSRFAICMSGTIAIFEEKKIVNIFINKLDQRISCFQWIRSSWVFLTLIYRSIPWLRCINVSSSPRLIPAYTWTRRWCEYMYIILCEPLESPRYSHSAIIHFSRRRTSAGERGIAASLYTSLPGCFPVRIMCISHYEGLLQLGPLPLSLRVREPRAPASLLSVCDTTDIPLGPCMRTW